MYGVGGVIRYLNHSGAARPDPVDLCKNVFHGIIKFEGEKKPGLSRHPLGNGRVKAA